MGKENKEKDLLVRVQPTLFQEFKEKCEQNNKSISEVVRDFMHKYIKGVTMFEPVSGPSNAEMIDGANRIFKAAMDNDGKVRYSREHTEAGEKEWLVMNQAAEWLVEQNMGRIERRTFEYFDFSVR